MARRRRAGGEEVHENEERWLLTYADMITLLMVLFVVMYAISNTDLRKFTAFAQSMAAAFNNDVFQGTQQTTISDGIQTSPTSGTFDQGSGVVATDYAAISAGLKDFAISNGIGEQVDVERNTEGIVIRIGGSILFESGRVVISQQSEKLLDKIVELIGPLPNNIRIEGHTDDVQPDNWLYTDNWRLSSDRALAVLSAMEQRGIAQQRMSIAAYAQYKPLVPNTDDASRARNRRVDLVILYPNGDTGVPAPSAEPSFVLP